MLGLAARQRAGLGSVPAAGVGLAPSAGGEFPREDSFRSLHASKKLKLGTHTSAVVRGKKDKPWDVFSGGALPPWWMTITVWHHFWVKTDGFVLSAIGQYWVKESHLLESEVGDST